MNKKQENIIKNIYRANDKYFKCGHTMNGYAEVEGGYAYTDGVRLMICKDATEGEQMGAPARIAEFVDEFRAADYTLAAEVTKDNLENFANKKFTIDDRNAIWFANDHAHACINYFYFKNALDWCGLGKEPVLVYVVKRTMAVYFKGRNGEAFIMPINRDYEEDKENGNV